MNRYKSRSPQDITERIDTYYKSEGVEGTAPRFRHALRVVAMAIGPANLLHYIGDMLWDAGDKKTGKLFHDCAALLDREM